MRFRFDPLSRAFLDRCVFGETAQLISVDGRPERFVRWCGRGLVSVMIYYHNHSCKSGHEPSFTAKLKMITTILRKFQIFIHQDKIVIMRLFKYGNSQATVRSKNSPEIKG